MNKERKMMIETMVFMAVMMLVATVPERLIVSAAAMLR